jgi:hypothetical protein
MRQEDEPLPPTLRVRTTLVTSVGKRLKSCSIYDPPTVTIPYCPHVALASAARLSGFPQRQATICICGAWCEQPACRLSLRLLLSGILPRLADATTEDGLAVSGKRKSSLPVRKTAPIRSPLLSTIAMPEICPRSFILFAMTAKRLGLAGNSVLRSVITLSSQMKARNLAFIVDPNAIPSRSITTVTVQVAACTRSS